MAASRVVLFDCTWNPAHDLQAVNRCYRYGQTKPVHVYRLVAEGFESCVYNQSIVKLQLAGRVVDEKQLDSIFSREELKELWRTFSGDGDGGRPLGEPAVAPADLKTHSAASLLPACADLAEHVAAVTDHDAPLADTEEVLDEREKDDALNEELEEAHNDRGGREGVHCSGCGCLRTGVVPWARLEVVCERAECGATTVLPPAAPIFKRKSYWLHNSMPANSLQFKLHGEKRTPDMSRVLETCIGEHGDYLIEIRVVPLTPATPTLADNEGWVSAVPKGSLKPGTEVFMKARLDGQPLRTDARYQLRVRGRIGPCACSCATLDDVKERVWKCAEAAGRHRGQTYASGRLGQRRQSRRCRARTRTGSGACTAAGAAGAHAAAVPSSAGHRSLAAAAPRRRRLADTGSAPAAAATGGEFPPGARAPPRAAADDVRDGGRAATKSRGTPTVLEQTPTVMAVAPAMPMVAPIPHRSRSRSRRSRSSRRRRRHRSTSPSPRRVSQAMAQHAQAEAHQSGSRA